MEYLISLLLGIFGSLLAWEISLRYRTWCVAIIDHAVKRLPDDQRAIRQEEWLAALNDHVGMFSTVSHAVGCWVGAPGIARASKPVTVKITIKFSAKGVLGLIGSPKRLAWWAGLSVGMVSAMTTLAAGLFMFWMGTGNQIISNSADKAIQFFGHLFGLS